MPDSMGKNRDSGCILIENDVIITPLPNRVSGYILIENDVIITPLPNRVSGFILIENLYTHSFSA